MSLHFLIVGIVDGVREGTGVGDGDCVLVEAIVVVGVVVWVFMTSRVLVASTGFTDDASSVAAGVNPSGSTVSTC